MLNCRLKALDVVTMRRLAERVNVIPIIAKADTACKDELVRFKSKVSITILLMVCDSSSNCELF